MCTHVLINYAATYVHIYVRSYNNTPQPSALIVFTSNHSREKTVAVGHKIHNLLEDFAINIDDSAPTYKVKYMYALNNLLNMYLIVHMARCVLLLKHLCQPCVSFL